MTAPITFVTNPLAAQYLTDLNGYERSARNLLDAFRVRVATFESEARAAGVAEANIIAVLQSTNLWDQATADLADVTIPTEIARVQNGGAIGVLGSFAPTAPPVIPAVSDILASQGGALTGSAQYVGGSVTISPPAVQIPPAVGASPTAATAGAIENVDPSVYAPYIAAKIDPANGQGLPLAAGEPAPTTPGGAPVQALSPGTSDGVLSLSSPVVAKGAGLTGILLILGALWLLTRRGGS